MANAHESHEVIVTENGLGRYQQAVTVGRHQLIADEPVSMNGADAGPAPFDYLLTALGACTSMTLRMYAEIKKIPLTNVHVALRHVLQRTGDGRRTVLDTPGQLTLTGDLRVTPCVPDSALDVPREPFRQRVGNAGLGRLDSPREGDIAQDLLQCFRSHVALRVIGPKSCPCPLNQ